MRLRDDTQNRTAAKCQHDECPTCREYLAFDTDGMGRVVCWCPHCRDGRPHSRAKYLARLAEEDAAWREPEMRRCTWCDAPYMPKGAGQRYCGASCREATANHRANERNRRLREGQPLPKRLALVARLTHCEACGSPLKQKRVGQPRMFCNVTCRNRRYRDTHYQPRRPESKRSAAIRRYWQNKITAI